jgi:hypothetical protein
LITSLLDAEMFFLISATNKNSPIPPFSLAYVSNLSRVLQVVYSIPATRLVLNLRNHSHDDNRHDQRPGHIVLEHISSISFAARHNSELDRRGLIT